MRTHIRAKYSEVAAHARTHAHIRASANGVAWTCMHAGTCTRTHEHTKIYARARARALPLARSRARSLSWECGEEDCERNTQRQLQALSRITSISVEVFPSLTMECVLLLWTHVFSCYRHSGSYKHSIASPRSQLRCSLTMECVLLL